MPFVERDARGNVCGLFTSRGREGQEELPDDHPEIVAFREAHPPPPGFLRPFNEAEEAARSAEHERIIREHSQIRDAVFAFHQAFAELETALSALLHAIIGDPKSHVAYAIYHSTTGFEARSGIVRNALLQTAAENAELALVAEKWAQIEQLINGARRTRNSIAHGSAQTLVVGAKHHARWAAPSFDSIRIGRPLADGQIPGLTASVIRDQIRRTLKASECCDRVNESVWAHRRQDGTLPEKYRALEARLTGSDSP